MRTPSGSVQYTKSRAPSSPKVVRVPAHHGTAERLDGVGDGVEIPYPQGEVGEAQLVHGAALALAEVARGVEVQQLDGHAVAAEKARLQGDGLELHERPEFVTDGVGLRQLEPEPLAVEAHRAFEVTDTDTQMRERDVLHRLLRFADGRRPRPAWPDALGPVTSRLECPRLGVRSLTRGRGDESLAPWHHPMAPAPTATTSRRTSPEDPGLGRGADLRRGRAPARPQAHLQERLDHSRGPDGGRR